MFEMLKKDILLIFEYFGAVNLLLTFNTFWEG